MLFSVEAKGSASASASAAAAAASSREMTASNSSMREASLRAVRSSADASPSEGETSAP
eukprot:CAMPEP_0115850156 /NCGR_PEP_ID=MMETSP0287-20121206/11818_1 /TAXON_ID=412157 /ORGANISM="Chrysochromulina rotalis, Strain UIO044" /LENGTH=58 /DNA_ID=CAMNT_0003304143 /DNA_START=396 /DNA_END=573 /DNA_ORIENTATION=-